METPHPLANFRHGYLRLLVAMLLAVSIAPPILAHETDPGTWTPTDSMHAARFWHTATLLPNGKVLVAGGTADGRSYYDSAELYDPASGTWSVTGSMRTPRGDHKATLLYNGKVLVVGGRTDGYLGSDGSLGREVDSAELYDPESGTWTPTGGKLDLDTAGASVTLLRDGTVLVVREQARLYNPATESWSIAAAPSQQRRYHAASLLRDGRVLVSGGIDFQASPYRDLSSAEIYDPASGAWSAAGDMSDVRSDHTAVTLHDGRVLIAGGGQQGYQDYSNAPDLYDPQTGSWTRVVGSTFRSASSAIYGISATLLSNGDVLFAGGTDGVDGPWAIGELFDPEFAIWQTPKPAAIERDFHTATLLQNGQVLIAGGEIYTTTFAIADSALLYTPQNAWSDLMHIHVLPPRHNRP